MEEGKIIFKEDRTYGGLVQIVRDSDIVLAFTTSVRNEIPHETYKTLVEMENYYTRFVLVTQDINKNHQRYGNINVVELEGCLVEDISKIERFTKGADIILTLGNFIDNHHCKCLVDYFYENAEDPGCVILSDSCLKDIYYSLNGFSLDRLWNESKELPSYKDISIDGYKEKYYGKKLDVELAHKMLCLSPERLCKMDDSEKAMCIGLAARLKWKFNDKDAKKGVGKWKLGEYLEEDGKLIEVIPSEITHPTEEVDKNHPFHKIWDAEILLIKHYFKESAYM